MRVTDDGRIIVHPSSLSNYQDCARRAAVKLFRDKVEIIGKPRRTAPTVGSVVGNAVHAGCAAMLEQTRVGEEPGLDAAVELGWKMFDVESQDGVETDPTTRDRVQARIQIKRMIEVFAHQVAPYHRFDLIEEEFLVWIDGDFYLSGKPDAVTTYGVIHDHKTGVKLGAYWPQLGGYSVILRTQDIEVTGVQVNFIKRVKYDRAQPDVENPPYNIIHCEDAYYDTVERLMRDYEMFGKTNSISAFPANPNSFMCSKKYCEAHSTPLCPFGKISKTGEEEVD